MKKDIWYISNVIVMKSEVRPDRGKNAGIGLRLTFRDAGEYRKEHDIMKKHIFFAAAVCMTAVMATACGSKNAQETTMAVETSAAETSAAKATKPDLSKVDPKMAEGPGAFETDESSAGVQVDEVSDEEMARIQSEAAAKLEKTDYKSYAKEIMAIVKSKDMEGLADHIDFPTYISCVKTNGGMVDTKEDFMKLDPAEIFSDEMEAAIAKVDVDTLEPVMAGIVLGDGTPNIILGIAADGDLAITGMNY